MHVLSVFVLCSVLSVMNVVIYIQVLLRMGFTHLELDNHFGGVAFLAWLVHVRADYAVF